MNIFIYIYIIFGQSTAHPSVLLSAYCTIDITAGMLKVRYELNFVQSHEQLPVPTVSVFLWGHPQFYTSSSQFFTVFTSDRLSHSARCQNGVAWKDIFAVGLLPS